MERDPRPSEARAMGGSADAEASDAILTIPNLITFARLALIPLFVWLGIGARHDVATWVVGFVAASTDFVDGKVARRLGQVSKLGIAMDPLSDRILLGAAAWVYLVRDFAPAPWVIWVVVARDALLLASLPFLARMGVQRPAVSWFGKAGTMGIMGGLGFFLSAHLPDERVEALTLVGWICYLPGLVFSYIAAAGYVRDVLRARGSGAQRAEQTG